eukprot:scaffold5649_cov51-Phaeocystis_antarctica.AAC.1
MLQAKEGMERAKKSVKVSANVSAGADTKANTSGVAAHLRLVIFVSLRMAASAVAPLALMLLPPRLRARGKMETRGHGAPLEPLAQLGDAIGGVAALALPIEPAELVRRQAAKGGVAVSMGADTKANTRGAAAHSRLVI